MNRDREAEIRKVMKKDTGNYLMDACIDCLEEIDRMRSERIRDLSCMKKYIDHLLHSINDSGVGKDE